MELKNGISNIKEKVEAILIPLFGNSIKEMIENFYSENNPSEILELADHMLKGYFGEKKAKEILKELTDHMITRQ